MPACPECGKEVSTPQALGSHRRVHGYRGPHSTAFESFLEERPILNTILHPLRAWRLHRIGHQPRRVGPCIGCGQPTHDRSVVVDSNLRRRKPFVCSDCCGRVGDHEYRVERTRRDWQEVTDPVRRDRLLLDQMPEQYPGISREALRAFLDSDATRAVVPDTTPSILNRTIATLGLDDEVYAEERSGETVLRKVAALTAR